jgi:hypothetical protein
VNHTWKRDERGEIDEFAHDVEAETTGHNGPRCTVCGFFFFIHCADAWGHVCPGPPPAGFEFDWVGDGTGTPLAEPELWRLPS